MELNAQDSKSGSSSVGGGAAKKEQQMKEAALEALHTSFRLREKESHPCLFITAPRTLYHARQPERTSHLHATHEHTSAQHANTGRQRQIHDVWGPAW